MRTTSSMKNLIRVLMIPAAVTLTASLAACEDKGPAEEAGESIDDAFDDVGDSIDEAAEEVEDEVDDATRD